MNKSCKKLCTTALALAACLTAPLALAACTDNGGIKGGGDGDSGICTVTFDAGQGVFADTNDRFYTVEIEKGSKVAAPSKTPVYEKHVFLGWNVTGSENDPLFGFDTAIDADTTLRAVWARGYTVTFDADGGTFASGGDTYEILVAGGAKLIAPDVTAPTDRKLGGWMYGYELWDFENDAVSRDMTLSARWALSDALAAELEPFEYIERGGAFAISGLKNKSATTVTIPSCVDTITEYAFKDCAELTEIVMHDDVKAIGRSAFESCSKLKKINLPSSLKRLESRLFAGCAALETITIPNTVDFVDAAIFEGCSSLKAVVLPTGVTEIPNYMFNYCESLEAVEVKGAVASIGSNAFKNCKKLVDFDVPSTVTNISSHAFEGCSSLATVAISAACKEIDLNAFTDCTGLTTVSADSETIGTYAFKGCTSLVSLTIGEHVKTIESNAFNGCTSLDSVTVPDNVTSLGSAFNGCTSLENVELGTGVTAVSSYLFNGCSALRNVRFNGAVTEIGNYAFHNCHSLVSFALPESVTKVGANAFADCYRLKEFVKTNANAAIASNAFSGSQTTVIASAAESKLVTDGGYVFYPTTSSTAPYQLVDYSGDSDALVLPVGCNGSAYSVGAYALAFNKRLKSVTFPASVDAIANSVITGSGNIETLAVAAGNAKYTAAGNCIIEKKSGISRYDKLIVGCKGSVIPSDADTVQAIGPLAFAGVTGLENFTIPSNIVNIDKSAFADCDYLMRTEGMVTYVDKWAISVAISDKTPFTLEFAADTVGIAGYIAGNDINVSTNMVRVVTNAALKHISDNAFSACSKIISVELNDGLLTIGSGAFYRNNSLIEIVVPDSVAYIGNSAFGSCTDLEYVKLPEGLTTIGNNMFDNCDSLKSVVIPSSVTSVGNNAFISCGTPTVYFGGDQTAWNAIDMGVNNTKLTNAKKVYYSETEETGKWHFGADGKPVVW